MTKHGPHRVIQYRRKREGRTDYKYRRNLIRSGKARLIARISLKNVRAQIAKPASEGDKIIASAFSKQLSKWGWKGHRSNTSAAYLVGLLCGYRGVENEAGRCILDLDRFVASPQAKIFAVLKGAVESGLNVSYNEDVLPSDERCSGEHISNYAQKLKSENEEKYKSQFSNYLENDLPPEDLPEHFNEVKQAIKKQYGE